jgi:hypothetical protein
LNSLIEIFSSSIEVYMFLLYMRNRGGINSMIWRDGLEIRVRQFGAATIRI